MTITEKKKKLGINPFTVSLEIPLTKTKMKDSYVQDGEFLMPKEIEYEATSSTKVYTDKILKEITCSLHPSTCKLYLWVIHSVYKQEDMIYINKETVMKDLKIKSINTLKKAIDELVRYGFITASREKDIWWINPMYFFKGNRVNKYPKNLVIKHDYTI